LLPSVLATTRQEDEIGFPVFNEIGVPS